VNNDDMISRQGAASSKKWSVKIQTEFRWSQIYSKNKFLRKIFFSVVQ